MLENPESGWSWAIEEAFRQVVKAKMLYIAWRDEEI